MPAKHQRWHNQPQSQLPSPPHTSESPNQLPFSPYSVSPNREYCRFPTIDAWLNDTVSATMPKHNLRRSKRPKTPPLDGTTAGDLDSHDVAGDEQSLPPGERRKRSRQKGSDNESSKKEANSRKRKRKKRKKRKKEEEEGEGEEEEDKSPKPTRDSTENPYTHLSSEVVVPTASQPYSVGPSVSTHVSRSGMSLKAKRLRLRTQYPRILFPTYNIFSPMQSGLFPVIPLLWMSHEFGCIPDAVRSSLPPCLQDCSQLFADISPAVDEDTVCKILEECATQSGLCMDEYTWYRSTHDLVDLAPPLFTSASSPPPDTPLFKTVNATTKSIAKDAPFPQLPDMKIDLLLCWGADRDTKNDKYLFEALKTLSLPRFNVFSDDNFPESPVVLGIEVKTPGESGGTREAECQLAVWGVKTYQLLTGIGMVDLSSHTPLPVIGVSVVGHNWCFHVIISAPPSDTREPDDFHVLGPFQIGSTANIVGVYRIVKWLGLFKGWVVECWWPAFKAAVEGKSVLA